MPKPIIAGCALVMLIFTGAFTGCGDDETKKVLKQDMTQFNLELGAYMLEEARTKSGLPAEDIPARITADCAPLNFGKTNCRIFFSGPKGTDTATAENVQRVGIDKFVWDHES